MKRLAILLALLLLIAGCSMKQAVTVEQPQTPVENTSAAIEQQMPELGLKTFKVNEPQTVAGKNVVVTDIDSSSAQVRATIDGEYVIFVGTKEKEIVNNLEMYVDSFKTYGAGDPRTYAMINFEEFKLGPNEYLLKKEKPLTVSGTTFTLLRTGMSDTGVRYAHLTPGGMDEQRIMQEETVSFGNLQVTNLKTFFKTQNYAVFRIVTA